MNVPEYRILVVDDQIGREGPFRGSFLKKTGRSPAEFVFCSAQDAEGRNRLGLVVDEVRALWDGRPDRRLSLVLLDIRFDDCRDEEGGKKFGFKVLRELRERFGRALPIVMLTGVTELREETNAAQADGFLPKEDLNTERLDAHVLRHALYPETGSQVLGTAPSFLLTLREVRRAVLSEIREFLFLGETGTGKSELARFVHRLSKRTRTGRLEPWFAHSNTKLHRSELFGYWKGAYTDADSHCAGTAERAHRGTLFLDEIAELAPEGQIDLLEYRQRGTDGLRRVRRLGNTPSPVKRGSTAGFDIIGDYRASEDRILVDTMLVAATNQPLDDAKWRTTAGFRNDLFNRLTLRVRLPSLRERVQDIAPLFIEFAKGQAGRSIVLATDAREALEEHPWREGNIQELKNLADNVVARLGPDYSEIYAHHFDGLLRGGEAGHSEAFVDIELRSLLGHAELLRAAVLETCRPTGLGSLADILKHAVGVEYTPTDVKREVKKILEAWFSPNRRQLARWKKSHAAYHAQAKQIQKDTILACLYKYACKEIAWDDAKDEILRAIQS